MLWMIRIVRGDIGLQACGRQPDSAQSCPGPGRRDTGPTGSAAVPATTADRPCRTMIRPSAASSLKACCRVEGRTPCAVLSSGPRAAGRRAPSAGPVRCGATTIMNNARPRTRTASPGNRHHKTRARTPFHDREHREAGRPRLLSDSGRAAARPAPRRPPGLRYLPGCGPPPGLRRDARPRAVVPLVHPCPISAVDPCFAVDYRYWSPCYQPSSTNQPR
jgi:hypothetical protein